MTLHRLIGIVTIAAGCCLRAAPVAAGESEPPKIRVDLHDDPLPPGALARLGSIRFHHPGGIAAMAFSRDGKHIVAVGQGKKTAECIVWDATSGKEISRFPDSGGYGAYGIAFMPDGKTVAVHNERHVKFYDWSTGKEVRTIGGERHHGAVALSPDGALLATSVVTDDRMPKKSKDKDDEPKLPKKKSDPDDLKPLHAIRILDVGTGKETTSLGLGPACPTRMSFSADGKRLVCRTVPEVSIYSAHAVTTDEAGHVAVWDIARGKKTHEVACPTRNVVFSPDGKTIAYQPRSEAPREDVSVVNLVTGKVACKIPVKSGSLRFSPDGKALVVVNGEGISILDPASGKLIGSLPGPLAEYANIGGFSADGKILATTSGGWHQDGVIRLWDLDKGTEIRTGGGHQNEVTCLAFTPNGKLLITGSRDWTIRIWDPATSRELRCLKGHKADVLALAITPDGKTLASISTDGMTRLWELPDGRALNTFDGPEGDRLRLAFTPDGTTLIASNAQGKSFIWDLTGDKKTSSREGLGKNVVLLALTPDGRGCLTTKWLDYNDDDRGDETLDLLSLFMRPARAMALHPCRHPKTRYPCIGAVIAADGKLIASWQSVITSRGPLPEDDGPAMQVWERASGRELFKTIRIYFDAMAFSRNGRFIAGSHATGATSWRLCRGGITLWDAWTGSKVGELPGHAALVGALAFAPDGETLASASGDHTVLIWDSGKFALKAKSEVNERQLAGWWDDLANADPVPAYRALAGLVAAPEAAVKLLAANLKPAAPIDMDRIAQLIEDLDSQRFITRQQAAAALEKIAAAEPLLRKALAGNPSLEMQRRLEMVLTKVEGIPLTPQELQSHRAIIALQAIATSAARALLTKLAGGAADARQTHEAEAALR